MPRLSTFTFTKLAFATDPEGHLIEIVERGE
jgi:hypothetical protein